MYRPFTQEYDLIEQAVCETLYEVVQELREVDFSTYAVISAKGDLKAATDIFTSAAEIYLLPGIVEIHDCWVTPDNWSKRRCVQLMLAMECASKTIHASLTLMDHQAELRLLHIAQAGSETPDYSKMDEAKQLARQIRNMRVIAPAKHSQAFPGLITERWNADRIWKH